MKLSEFLPTQPVETLKSYFKAVRVPGMQSVEELNKEWGDYWEAFDREVDTTDE